MKLAFAPPNPSALLSKLFSVTVTHTFYTANDGLCPDFMIEPTPSSLSLMGQLGMAFRTEAAGFSIFIQRDRLAGLLAYLQENARSMPDGTLEYWSRLTFSLRLLNPVFVDITALPLATKSTKVNLYGSNCQAHQEAAGIVLTAQQFMGAEALRPVVGNEVSLALPAEAKRVLVTDISGAVVIPAPGEEPISLMPAQNGTKRARIDFSGLPYDLYTINVLDAEHQSINTPKFPWNVLYTAQQPDSMALLNIVFTQPTPQSAGVYPISSLFGDQPGDLTGVAYRLPFEARSTQWQYFVVSQDSKAQLRQLEISSKSGLADGAHMQFLQDAHPTLLPDGSSASVLKSAQPLSLRQKSPHCFELTGLRQDASGHENAIRIARLPVAPSTPVWPDPDQESPTGISEIFVYV